MERRFHSPVGHLREQAVRRLVSPPHGWSLVATTGPDVVGHGCAGELSPTTVEIGLLVDDAYQGTGVGTRLVRDLAATATERGYHSMVCLVEPDNDSVLRTLRRAGLTGAPVSVDGLIEIDVALPRSRDRRQPA